MFTHKRQPKDSNVLEVLNNCFRKLTLHRPPIGPVKYPVLCMTKWKGAECLKLPNL